MKFLPILLAAAATLHAAPVVSVITPFPGATVSSLTSVSVTFNEPVTGLSATDLGLNGEPIVAVTGSGAGPYVFSFPQPPPGSVSLGWDVDQSISGIGTGLFAPAGGWSYTLTDTVAPAVGKIRTSVAGQELDDVFPTPGSTAAVVTEARVTFSETVTGVSAADLLVNGVPATAVTGDVAGPYVFTFPQPAPGATVAFTWAAGHGIMDAAGNAFAGAGWTVNQGTPGTVRINEFLVNNGGTAVTVGSDTDGTRDENWDLSSWIELHNPGTTPVSLLGWSLTDDTANPRQWVLPARNLAAGARLVIFASGKDRRPLSGMMHTNFGLNDKGGTLALYSPDSPAATPASIWANYPPQRYDYSYGAQSTDGQPRYFTPPTVSQGAYTVPTSDGVAGTLPPTPVGAINGTSSLLSLTPEPQANVSRGFFNEPFSVILSCSDATATIRYTLDGSPPLVTSPAYTTALNISATTVLRAAAFGTGKVPSLAVTHTYLFADQVVNQPSPPYALTAGDTTKPQPPSPGGSPLPVAWGINSTFAAAQTLTGFNTGTATGANNLTAGQIPADYGMDSKVWADPTKYNDAGAVDAVNGKTNLERIKNCLRTQPTLSLVIRSTDMFGTYPNGQATAAAAGNPAAPLYPNSSASVKTDMTKACSLELMEPDGNTVFVTDAGIDLHGNASRDSFKNPKHGFTLRFKGRYGAGKVSGKIFPDSPVREWDKLVLRGDFGGSWLHQNGNDGLAAGSDNYQRARGIRIREAWCKDSFRDMGRVASHHRFCNLFINGVCWGSYELMEDEAEDFGASYMGGNKDDFDVNDQGKLKSGTWNVWSALKTLIGWTGGTATTDPATAPTAAVFLSAFTNTQYETLRTYLDMPWFQDYMIWQFFSGHRDWGTSATDAAPWMKNVYFVRPKGGTFRAMPWDMENLLWHESEDRVTGASADAAGAVAIRVPAAIHPRAKNNAEYRLEFADRAWRHLVKPNGALTPAANVARMNKWVANFGVDSAVLESARWGDYRYKVHAYTLGTVNQVYTWNGAWYDNSTAAQYDGSWASGQMKFNTGRTLASQLGTYTGSMSNAWYDEIRRLNTVYFPARSTNVLSQFRTNGLYPFLNAPELRDNATNALLGDAQVASGTAVKLVMPAAGTGSSTGDIFYTLDGTDPRPQYDQTGTPRATAALYSTPLTITQPVTIKARARATPASFPSKPSVRAATTAALTVTYTAAGGASLRGQITAAPLTLDGLTLAAGDRILLKNQAAGAQNGIWTVTTPGTGTTGVWDRAADWDADGEVVTNTWVRVNAGTNNAESIWRVTNPGAITVGGASGTAITFTSTGFSPWSALMEIRLTVGAPLPTVVISEINYNPRGAQGGTAAEFIEFYNYGSLPVDMTSWSMDGVDFIFPAATVLQPGQRLVIGSNNNPVTFTAQYPGVVVLGYFGGTLDNGGERLSLLDGAGRVVCSVEYSDTRPWPETADNGGYSMELTNPAADLQNGANWHASANLKGSPGAANSIPPAGVIISEFFAAGGDGYGPGGAPLPDFIELLNTGSTAQEVGGWALNDFLLPSTPDTLLNPGARLVVYATPNAVPGINLGAVLNRTQGEIVLRNGYGTVDSVRYGPQITNHSFYRDGSTWRLCEPAPGMADSPAFSQAAGALRINEIMANPVPGQDDWLELYNIDSDDPCVLTGLTFDVNGSSFRVSAPAVIQGDSYRRLWCNPGGQNGDNLNLSLPAPGGTVSIRDDAWNLAASQTYSALPEGVTHGRVDSIGWTSLEFPSPDNDNVLLDPVRVRLNEVLVINETGDNALWARRPAWVEIRNPLAAEVDLSGWTLRSVGDSSETWHFPAGTSIPAGGLLTVWCDIQQAASTVSGPHLNSALPLDSGYLRWGVELADEGGYTQDRITWGRQIPDLSIGRLPDNSWALLTAPTRGMTNTGAAALAPATGVKLNEWFGGTAANQTLTSFIELYNPAAQPAPLAGLWLGDEPSEAGRRRWQIPALSYAPPSGHALFTTGSATSRPVQFSFDLASGGEYVRLSQNDSAATPVDATGFGGTASIWFSQGRTPDGSAATGTLTPTPGSANTTTGPVIVTSPSSVAVPAGQSVTLTASGYEYTSLQWRKNGTPISGATELFLNLSALTAADEADYTLALTNAGGTVVTSPAHVTVLYNWSAYAAQYGLPSLTGDADADGISNGDEFLAGSNPLAASPLAGGVLGGFETVSGTNYLTLEHTVSRRAAFSSLTAEQSSDLSLWNTAPGALSETLSTAPNGDQRIKVRFPILPSDDREFVRLNLVP